MANAQRIDIHGSQKEIQHKDCCKSWVSPGLAMVIPRFHVFCLVFVAWPVPSSSLHKLEHSLVVWFGGQADSVCSGCLVDPVVCSHLGLHL